MNLSQKTSLSLLLVSLSAMPATAAMSGDDGVSDDVAIETVSNRNALHPLDHLLEGGNHSDLFRSVLQQHASAAQSANSMMDGHFGSAGAEQPVVFGQRSLANETMPPSPPSPPAEAPNLSLTVAARMGGSQQADTGGASVSSPNSSTTSGLTTTNDISFPNTPGTNTETPATPPPPAPVPLPGAGLLLASGLAGLPLQRRLRLRQDLSAQ